MLCVQVLFSLSLAVCLSPSLSRCLCLNCSQWLNLLGCVYMCVCINVCVCVCVCWCVIIFYLCTPEIAIRLPIFFIVLILPGLIATVHSVRRRKQTSRGE